MWSVYWINFKVSLNRPPLMGRVMAFNRREVASSSQRVLPVLPGPCLSCLSWTRADMLLQHSEWMQGRSLVRDVWCESWTFYFFGCLCFWSHPSLVVERWQLCSFLDWSPFVENDFHIFEFFLCHSWLASRNESFLGRGYRLCFLSSCHSLRISVVCFRPCAS